MTTTPRVAAKTVLVADDTAFVRDRFKVAIEGAGHKAVTAQNGPELLGCIRTAKDEIDLIVLDLRLPQGNGIAMLRALRKVEACRLVVLEEVARWSDSMFQTVSTVRHEINNSLMGLLGQVELLLDRGDLPDVARQKVVQVQAEAERIRRRVADLSGIRKP